MRSYRIDDCDVSPLPTCRASPRAARCSTSWIMVQAAGEAKASHSPALDVRKRIESRPIVQPSRRGGCRRLLAHPPQTAPSAAPGSVSEMAVSLPLAGGVGGGHVMTHDRLPRHNQAVATDDPQKPLHVGAARRFQPERTNIAAHRRLRRCRFDTTATREKLRSASPRWRAHSSHHRGLSRDRSHPSASVVAENASVRVLHAGPRMVHRYCSRKTPTQQGGHQGR